VQPPGVGMEHGAHARFGGKPTHRATGRLSDRQKSDFHNGKMSIS